MTGYEMKKIAALRAARDYALDQKYKLPVWVEGQDTLHPERVEWNAVVMELADEIEKLGGKVLR